MAARRRFPLTSLPEEIFPFVCQTLLDSEVFLGLARTCKAIHAIVFSDAFAVSLRDIGMPRHHAEIFFAAAEEEKRRQIDEGDRWDPTVSFQRELNKLNYRADRGSRTNDTVELLSDPELRAKLFPGDEDCDDRRRGLCPGYRVLGDLIAKHAADSPAVAISSGVMVSLTNHPEASMLGWLPAIFCFCFAPFC